MLKRCGVIKKDPPYNDRIMLRSVAKIERPSYLNEARELKLKSLLASKNPEDLKSANLLIQNMLREDDEKAEKQARRLETIETALTKSTQLISLIEDLSPGSKGAGLSWDQRQSADLLYQECGRLRPTIFRMASEVSSRTEDADDSDQLVRILKANDEITKAIGLFDVNVGSIITKSEPDGKPVPSKPSDNLLDLDFSETSGPSNTELLTQSFKDVNIQPCHNTTSLLDQTPPPLPFAPKTYTIEELSLDAQKSINLYDKDGVKCIATCCQDNVALFTTIEIFKLDLTYLSDI